jgi:hypothetical protein
MTYYRIFLAAKAANARADQLALIRQIKEVTAQPVITRCGTVKRYRDESIKRKLERWLTALQVEHREDEFWQEVVEQASRSLAAEKCSDVVAM